MAVYAIGDVQGCLDPLRTLLEQVEFDAMRDTLWFAGDLVNRGPQSLEVLRFVRDLGDRAVVVLGNHDLHLLAVASGVLGARSRDTFQPVLQAPDREELLSWLRNRPLFYHDGALGFAMVHAGILPQWDLADAERLAREVEHILSRRPEALLPFMYGDLPDHWHEDLEPPDRWRVVINAFTRLRYCKGGGNIYLEHKASRGNTPPGLMPWFNVPGRRTCKSRIIFGHWVMLNLHPGGNVVSLDSGCGWGGGLTAVRLDITPMQFYSVPGPKGNYEIRF